MGDISATQCAWLSVAGMVFCMTFAQVFFKLAGLYSAHNESLLNTFIFNPWLLVALASSSAGMLLWLLALRHLPLSIAYPWTALVYILTPLISALLFQDVLSLHYILGMGCVIAGVFITTTSITRVASQ